MENDQIRAASVDPGRQALSEKQRLLLARRLRGLDGKSASAIDVRPPGSSVVLSAEQKRIWLHASQQPDSAIYNEPITIQKSGAFSLEVLNASMDEIVRRHESWRTTFDVEGKGTLHPPFHVKIPFSDVSSFPPDAREEEALLIATAEAQQPLRLAEVPLFRVHVVRIDANDHRIYLTLHHIIFDGISLANILLPELASTYEAQETGSSSPLPEPKIQYPDYALWRERQLSSPTIQAHLAYWLKHLDGDLPVLRLPTDRPRPAKPSHRGSMERFTVPQSLTTDLRGYCRLHSVTMYMAVLAAYKVLLFRYSGQEDIIVGSAIDARRHPALKDVMGYFLDTVAIRTKPLGHLAFADYLLQTRESVLDALTASDVPFDRVVHELRPKRDSSHHPIFQAFFSMRPLMAVEPAGWKLRHLDVAVEAAKFDLYLELGEQPNEIEGRFLYNKDIFDAATVTRMKEHLLRLLRDICDSPEKSLSELAILGDKERATLLGADGCNSTEREFPQQTLQILVDEQAQRTPAAIAIVAEGKKLTYEDLRVRMTQIASSLAASGVVRGSVVAVALERSVDLLAGMLAILRLGAAYLPLDIAMSPERFSKTIAHAQPSALLTQELLLARFEPTNVEKVLVEKTRETAVASDSHLHQDNLNEGSPSDTAYIIYTSGTTGEPKAVEISHSALTNFLSSMQREPGFTASDILLALTPVSFDIAALELFLPLFSGGTVIIGSREEVQDPYLLARAIKQSRCTVVQATPATWRTLLRSGWKDANLDPEGLVSGRLRILCGGESMTGDLAEQLLATGGEVWNMYGPTETTIWSLISRVSFKDAGQYGSVSVGRPIANTQAYILDRSRDLVPLGVPGDLFIGGMGLAKGYRGDAEKTQDRFVQLEALGGARVYHTGDLAVRRADGTIQVLGRTDNQVKIRGYRVELEAVEAAVLRHPNVSATAARALLESTGDQRLVVYVVGKNGGPPDLPALRSFLKDRLPEYMIPTYVMSLPALPLSSNGKIDRSSLPTPSDETQRPVQSAITSPEEAGIAAIWASLLGVDTVDTNQDFFALGGHSVLVAELQQKILVTFGQQIPMAELFHQPTVSLQAALLRRARENTQELPQGILELQSEGSGKPLFWLHFATEGLAKAVGTNQPFYSVVLTGDDLISLGSQPKLRDIAAAHLTKIKSIQPQGPYQLGGFCVGGVVALEVAALLQAEGQDTSRLVLVDSPNPNPDPIKRVYRYCRWLLGSGGWRALAYSIEKRLEDFSNLLRKRRTAEHEMRTTQDIIEGSTSGYHPPKYQGDVLLVQASDRLHMDLCPPWEDVISPNLHTEYVDGHHDDLMKLQNVGDVGSVIRRYIHLEDGADRVAR